MRRRHGPVAATVHTVRAGAPRPRPVPAGFAPEGENEVSRLNKRDRMRILELSAEIAAEASRNPNVVFMIEFEERLIEATYRKMVALLEADLNDRDDDESEDARDGDAAEAGPGAEQATASAWSRESREQASAGSEAPARRTRTRKASAD
jgi:hypothetical protein